MELTTVPSKDRATAGFTPSPTEPLKHQLPATLSQHRMASTDQLHVLLRPGRSRQSVSEQLNDCDARCHHDSAVCLSFMTATKTTCHSLPRTNNLLMRSRIGGAKPSRLPCT